MRKLPTSVWQNSLNRDDWDFSAIPDHQLHTCCRYEYLRENAQRLNGGVWPRLAYSRSFIKAERASQKKISSAFCPPIRAFDLSEFQNDQAMMSWFSDLHSEGFQQFYLAINWSATNTDLVDAFKKYLLSVRPRRASRKNTGRASGVFQAKAALRNLGAFRVLQHLRGDWRAAKEFIKDNSPANLGKNMGRASGWSELKKRVMRDLRRCHQILASNSV